jgi:hypothetical protein
MQKKLVSTKKFNGGKSLLEKLKDATIQKKIFEFVFLAATYNPSKSRAIQFYKTAKQKLGLIERESTTKYKQLLDLLLFIYKAKTQITGNLEYEVSTTGVFLNEPNNSHLLVSLIDLNGSGNFYIRLYTDPQVAENKLLDDPKLLSDMLVFNHLLPKKIYSNQEEYIKHCLFNQFEIDPYGPEVEVIFHYTRPKQTDLDYKTLIVLKLNNDNKRQTAFIEMNSFIKNSMSFHNKKIAKGITIVKITSFRQIENNEAFLVSKKHWANLNNHLQKVLKGLNFDYHSSKPKKLRSKNSVLISINVLDSKSSQHRFFFEVFQKTSTKKQIQKELETKNISPNADIYSVFIE